MQPVLTLEEFEAFEKQVLITAVRQLAATCHNNAVEAGWWYNDLSMTDLKMCINGKEEHFDRLFAGALIGQKLCLIHSEISEAMEGARKNLMDDKLKHRTMLEVELADAIIRIFDLGGALRLDIVGAIIEKLEFNKTRPDHKPENRAKEGGKSF